MPQYKITTTPYIFYCEAVQTYGPGRLGTFLVLVLVLVSGSNSLLSPNEYLALGARLHPGAIGVAGNAPARHVGTDFTSHVLNCPLPHPVPCNTVTH